MYCPVCLAPEGSLYPLTSPGNFFLGGGKRVPAVGARPRRPRPRPQGPPAMASWAPCTAMASRAPSSAMASRAPSSAMASVVCSALEVPVLCSCPCLSWGASRAPSPPPRWNCYGVGHAFREGGVMSGFCCVSSVPASCVHIWIVSCPRQMSLWVNSCPAVFVSLCVNYPVYLVPVFWVWFRLVYLWLPSVSCLSALSCPALMFIKDYYLSLSPRLRVPVSSLVSVHRDTFLMFTFYQWVKQSTLNKQI